MLCPLHGYLLLAQSGRTGPWNFGPSLDDAKPVRWVVDRLGVAWETDEADHPHEATLLSLDSTKARTELGWDPRWDLECGLEATAAYYERGADLRLDQIAAYATS